MKKQSVAILGSTSHIAKGLINNFLQTKGFALHLYTRSRGKLHSFLASIGKSTNNGYIIRQGYRDFLKGYYDVIINCVGVGILKLRGDYSEYFTVTEEYDNLAIGFLRKRCPDSLYVSFSSGAVYGREFLTPAQGDTVNGIRVNHISPQDYYAIARLNAEAKHRSFKGLKIIDLRIFSYFSRFIDLSEGYFISEIINCILKNKVFLTDNVNIVRDYVHPYDLFRLVVRCIKAGKINRAFDVCSLRPVEKKEILSYFSSVYGLKYKIRGSLTCLSPTGRKNIYYSKYNSTATLGYKPRFSSLDTIAQEAKYIINI